MALEASLPLAHGSDEQRRHRVRGAVRQRPIEFVERLTGPERLLEAVHGAPGARVEHSLVDRDRPDPDRADQQPDHHRLDDPMGVPEQREQRKIGRGQREHRLRHVGRIHRHVLSAQSGSVGRTGAAQYPQSTCARDDAAHALSRKPNVSRSFVCPVHRRPTKSPRNLAKLGRESGLFRPKQR